MGAKDVLTRKTGVIVGDDVLNLFKYAQQKNFAIPAIVSLFPIITQPCH
jgi:fructose-bisphosphate aldolase, class II